MPMIEVKLDLISVRNDDGKRKDEVCPIQYVYWWNIFEVTKLLVLFYEDVKVKRSG